MNIWPNKVTTRHHAGHDQPRRRTAHVSIDVLIGPSRRRCRRHLHRCRDARLGRRGSPVRQGADDAGRRQPGRDQRVRPVRRRHGTGRLLHPRHDARPERPADAERRPDGDRHDRRLPRRVSPRAHRSARLLRLPVQDAREPRPSRRDLRGPGADELPGPGPPPVRRRRRASRRRTAQGRRVRVGGRVLPARVHQPRPRAADARDPRRRSAGDGRHAVPRAVARVPGVRAHQHRGLRRLHQAGGAALPRPAQERAGRERLRGPLLHDPLGGRRDDGRERPRGAGEPHPLRPGRWGDRGDVVRADDR